MAAAAAAVLPLAIAMLPVNAAVYVLDGVFVGASDFKFLAGECGALGESVCVCVCVCGFDCFFSIVLLRGRGGANHALVAQPRCAPVLLAW